MSALVDDLFLLAHLDEGRPLAQEAVDLDAVVADAIEVSQALDPDRPVTVETRETVVIGDRSRLRQLVDNLLANVRAHTPATAPLSVVAHPLRRERGPPRLRLRPRDRRGEPAARVRALLPRRGLARARAAAGRASASRSCRRSRRPTAARPRRAPGPARERRSRSRSRSPRSSAPTRRRRRSTTPRTGPPTSRRSRTRPDLKKRCQPTGPLQGPALLSPPAATGRRVSGRELRVRPWAGVAEAPPARAPSSGKRRAPPEAGLFSCERRRACRSGQGKLAVLHLAGVELAGHRPSRRLVRGERREVARAEVLEVLADALARVGHRDGEEGDRSRRPLRGHGQLGAAGPCRCRRTPATT